MLWESGGSFLVVGRSNVNNAEDCNLIVGARSLMSYRQQKTMYQKEKVLGNENI